MTLRLAWRWLKTDCRTAEFRLLALALWLSTSLIIGLSGFMDKVQIMLVGQSSEFLAADRVLSSPRAIDEAWLLEAKAMQLSQARSVSFQSMLNAADEPVLVSVKAADLAYPLKGKLQYRDSLYDEVKTTSTGPELGHIWVSARLLVQMNLSVGDQVDIGDARFTIAKELVSEPDRGAGAFSLGPRVLMRYEDVAKTEVIQFGSRLRYRYMFSGQRESLQQYADYLQPLMTDSHKWIDLETSQPSIAIALQRGKNFFYLASSIVIVFAAIAIAMSSLRYTSSHTKHVAVLKSLGASRARIIGLMVSIIVMVFLLVGLLGSVTGHWLQQSLLQFMSREMQLPIPVTSSAETLKPFMIGLFCCGFALLSFLLPAMYRLSFTPAKAVFMQSASGEIQLMASSLWLSAIGLAGLIASYTQSVLLAVILIAAVALIVGLLVLPATWLFARLSKLPLRAATVWQLAISQLSRRLWVNTFLTGVFSLCLTLLFILFALQTALFEQWQKQLPAETPNFFLLNIKSHQFEQVDAYLAAEDFQAEGIYPMVRGRLVAINQQSVRDLVSKEALKRAGADRELNLSWSASMPSDNELLAGEWWDTSQSQPVSVESELAQKLGIQLGDELTFQVAAERFQASVTSLRKVEWDRMRPNFYMLFPQSTLEPFDKTFMTSFYLPSERHQEVVQLLNRFPNLVLIDVDHMIQQIQSIVAQVSFGLKWVVLLVFLASLLVLLATVQSSMSERLHENALLRAIGASKSRIRGALAIEFLLLGGVGGLLAVIVGQLLILLLQSQLLNLPSSLQPELWLLPIALGASLVTIVGLWSTQKVVTQSPSRLLKVF